MNSLLLAIPGGASIALIVVAILLLFGGKKIPELMRGLGKGISEFKKGKNEIENEINDTNENKEDN
jgi:sec-independent protein translocase protein TatA|tara:strand:- start:5054 stop:5251 length:198 start_codon:yes stop_codon:yes gene_type:complete